MNTRPVYAHRAHPYTNTPTQTSTPQDARVVRLVLRREKLGATHDKRFQSMPGRRQRARREEEVGLVIGWRWYVSH